MSRGRAALIGGAAAVALTAGGLTTVVLHDRGENHDSLHEFVKENGKGLNHHSMALAAIKEKVEQGGEASGEVTSGPAQEDYENRAFPRSTVAAAQSTGARTAFQTAVKRTGKGSAPGIGGWAPVGPTTGYVPGAATYTGTPSHVAGRTTALALGADHKTVYLGSSGGGVWKTSDIDASSVTWTPIGSDIPSQAIGSVYVAPNGDLYVGTGEPSGSSDSEAGVGLFRSTDGGASFTEVTGFHQYAQDRSVSAVAVDPSNPQHLYAGTAVARHGASSVNGGRYTPPGAAPVGLFESTDGGASWTQVIKEDQDAVLGSSATGNDFFRGGVSKIQVDPTTPSTVYASVFDYGLYRRRAADTGFSRIYTIGTPGALATSSTSRVEFAAVPKDGATRIYLGDATKYNNSVSGFLRTDDATADAVSWTTLSSPDKTSTGYDSYNFCQGQCSYDMVVSATSDQPDRVVLSGSMNYNEIFYSATNASNGRAVIRSTNAGVSFTDMTNDAAASPNGLHPDHHALLLLPGSPERFVSASDGGVVRQSAPFVDISSQCSVTSRPRISDQDRANCTRWLSAVPTSNTELNQGLNTLQFESVSLGSSAQVQGGTQDNGTWESDSPNGFEESVGGDGGSSGFNRDNPSIRYHSYYAPQHDTNFRGSDPYGWDWTSDPLLASGEGASFYTPLTADPVVGGTVFDGLQHIWRTTDDGGSQAFLDSNCNEFTGTFKAPCGDWQKLGDPALNSTGDLSGTAYGSDYAGAANYVVAIERSPRKNDVMWAATRRGRLFVSTNANAADPASVSYTRVDRTATGDALPSRFVSGISVDPADPFHVFVTYSGYSAYSSGGHVYELRYDPATKTVSSVDESYDLGDVPVTDVVWDYRTGATFIGTDFGVLARAAGSQTWQATAGLPRVATYGLTVDPASKRLYAATHGRGIWSYRIS